MKKLVATLATGVIIAGVTFTSVSAEEYNIKKGDNLWNIAEKYDTTVEELVDINELKTTVIQPKQKLFINQTYKVENGDTLIGISNEYDVSVEDLKKWNDLKSDIIVVGQELEIKGVNVEQEETNSESASTEEVSSSESSTEETSSSEKSSNEASSNTSSQSDTSSQTAKKEDKSQESPDGKTISVTATAYTADCAGCSGVTSTGVDLNANPNAKVIAVDPNVIPLGSKVYVEGYGYATAADVGGAINGNRIDIHVPTKDEAFDWGRRSVSVTIVN